METTTGKRIIAGLAAVAMCGTMVPSAMAAGTVESYKAYDSDADGKVSASTQLEVTTTGWTDPDGGTHGEGTYQVVVPTKVSWKANVGDTLTADGTKTSYNVTVRGKLTSTQVTAGTKVKLTTTAPTDNKVTTTDSKELTVTLTTGKVGGSVTDVVTGDREWTSDQLSIADTSPNVDKTAGTTAVDSAAVAGEVTSVNTYTGTVGYSAELTTN